MTCSNFLPNYLCAKTHLCRIEGQPLWLTEARVTAIRGS